MARRPLELWVDDWLADDDLRAATDAAVGALYRFMLVASKAEQAGVVKLPLAAIARRSGASLRGLNAALEAGLIHGVEEGVCPEFRHRDRNREHHLLIPAQEGPIYWVPRLVVRAHLSRVAQLTGSKSTGKRTRTVEGVAEGVADGAVEGVVEGAADGATHLLLVGNTSEPTAQTPAPPKKHPQRERVARVLEVYRRQSAAEPPASLVATFISRWPRGDEAGLLEFLGKVDLQKGERYVMGAISRELARRGEERRKPALGGDQRREDQVAELSRHARRA